MSVPELQTGLSATAFTGQLEEITQMMREISRLSDPEEVFREYSLRIRNIFPSDRVLLIRRAPEETTSLQMVEITDWDNPIHPWDSSEKYTPLTAGLLAQLFDQADATLLHDFEVSEEDPAFTVLEGMRSLRAIPLFEQGETSQMVIGLKAEPNSYREEDLAAMVWLSNLFGRAIQNLMLAQKVKQAYQSVDRELKVIGEIQHSLLPEELPQIPSLELAAYYQTSQRAGGDYYDFFPLPDGRLGILIADVSGHGTPAAVVMAIIHTIAHTYTGSHDPPSEFLNYLNTHLSRRYTAKNGTFVTAFYGIFDPETRNFKYASAGHNPPIRRRCGASSITMLDKAGRMPLGISEDITYDDAEELLYEGDRVVIYTDGIIEAHSPTGELYGVPRLGEQISKCDLKTRTIVDSVVESLREFTQTSHLSDDRTMVVMKIR